MFIFAQINCMKKVLVLLAITAVVACNNNDKNEANADTTSAPVNDNSVQEEPTNPDTSTSNAIKLPGQICFQSIVQRDTINIKLNVKDTLVYGELEYNMFEKDDNKGRFKGLLINNVLKANYTFRSEGILSIREVIFKLEGDKLTEGFGEMEQKDNRFVFKDPASVKFTQVYTRVDCK